MHLPDSDGGKIPRLQQAIEHESTHADDRIYVARLARMPEPQPATHAALTRTVVPVAEHHRIRAQEVLIVQHLQRRDAEPVQSLPHQCRPAGEIVADDHVWIEPLTQRLSGVCHGGVATIPQMPHQAHARRVMHARPMEIPIVVATAHHRDIVDTLLGKRRGGLGPDRQHRHLVTAPRHQLRLGSQHQLGTAAHVRRIQTVDIDDLHAALRRLPAG